MSEYTVAGQGITWPEFVELFREQSGDLPEQLDSLASKSGLSRPEVGYLFVGLGDEIGITEQWQNRVMCSTRQTSTLHGLSMMLFGQSLRRYGIRPPL